jgi:ribosomal protein L11 methylase PrmA
MRYVSKSYAADYDYLMQSGLYQELVDSGLLVPHKEVAEKTKDPDRHRLLEPEIVPFISYPYEWSFSQLKDAALATIKIQQDALKHDMVLKDASAYNIQFHNGKPLLIDTLSFERYKEDEPWVAYRQFCQHFLAPLALASYVDIRLLKLLREYIDGIPVDLTARMLPSRTRFKPGLGLNIHLHAKTQRKYADAKKYKKSKVSQRAMSNLIYSLERLIESLSWKPGGTEWGDYYSFTNYDKRAFKAKADIVEGMIKKAKPKSVWDLGANTGEFSRLASRQGIFTVAADVDPVAVEKNYLAVKQQAETSILPLLMDLTSPSPDLGWANRERDSLENLGPSDLIMALALIHHLAISNNVPLAEVASYFSRLGKYLIIEFVPKEDSQTQKLLTSREDIFGDYNQTGFEEAFGKYYQVVQKAQVKNSKRTIYLLKAK